MAHRKSSSKWWPRWMLTALQPARYDTFLRLFWLMNRSLMTHSWVYFDTFIGLFWPMSRSLMTYMTRSREVWSHCVCCTYTHNTLQHTATLCNTLQHSATHCNTLQHTATHCNTLQPARYKCISCAAHIHTHTQITNVSAYWKPDEEWEPV